MIEAMFQPGFQQMQPCNAKQILIHTFESAISSLEVSSCQSIVFSPTNFLQTIDNYSITTPSIGMISTPIDSKSKVLQIYDDNSAWYRRIEPQFTKNLLDFFIFTRSSSILISTSHMTTLLGTTSNQLFSTKSSV